MLERNLRISGYGSTMISMSGSHTQSSSGIRSCGFILFREGGEESLMVIFIISQCWATRMHEPVTGGHAGFKQ